MRPSPMRAAATRVVAVLVAVLFLGGAAGTSGLDALLFHRGAPAPATGTHVEAGATAGHHADQCLLALHLAGGRMAPRLSFPIRPVGLPLVSAASAPAALPLRLYTGLLQQSRAPPAVPLG